MPNPFTAKDAKAAKENQREWSQRSRATTKIFLPQRPQRNTEENQNQNLTAEAADCEEETRGEELI